MFNDNSSVSRGLVVETYFSDMLTEPEKIKSSLMCKIQVLGAMTGKTMS